MMMDNQPRTIEPENAADLYEDGVISEETNPYVGPWTYVTVQDIGSRRWQSDHRMILLHEDGTHWGLNYSIGLTEYQPHTLPWEDSDQPIPLTRVWPHQITRTVYRTKPPVSGEPTDLPGHGTTDTIRHHWLTVCGHCDAGLPMSCTCPTTDPRAVIATLCDALDEATAPPVSGKPKQDGGNDDQRG